MQSAKRQRRESIKGIMGAASFAVLQVSLRLTIFQGHMEVLALSRMSSLHADHVMTSWTIPLRGKRCSKRQQITSGDVIQNGMSRN